MEDQVDRNRVEDPLRQREKIYQANETQARVRAAELQAIMDAAPAAIFIAHDPECRLISGNRAAYALLRQQPGSNLSKSSTDNKKLAHFRLLRDGCEIPALELPIQKAASTGQPVHNCELQMMFEDGSSIDLFGNVEPMLDDKGRPQGAVAVLSDNTERKRAEAALRESEERFRNMADTAPVMIWLTGSDKAGTFFNKPWLDFTGRTMEQELGEGWISSVHPEDLEYCLATCLSAFNARRSFQMEFRMRRADGEYRWVLDRAIPRYRKGEFAGFIGSCIDVTERRVMEERLRANEVQLMEAQHLAKLGSFEFDVEAGTVHWSDELFRILGLPKEAQPEFSSFLKHVHPKDLAIVSQARDKAVSSIAPVDAEFRIVRPTGDVRFVRSNIEALRNDRGIPVRFVGATQDITDQVHARELLRESEERLKNAERIAHVGNWRWDIKNQLVFWSEELFRIFGNPQNCTPSYEQFIQFVVPQERDRVAQWVTGCLTSKIEDSLEFQITRPNGDLRTVACIIEVTRDEEGAPVHMSGTCQDITDFRRAQEESLDRQKLESVGTLASGIAHDFNNLLGGVLAQAELALAELAAGAQPVQELQRIRDVATHGAEIVRQLMIYAGKEGEVLELVDVSRIAAEMLDLLRVSVSKHAVLETNLGTNLPAVRANAAQIRQIVMNLVTNASEGIGDRNGVIRVATSKRVLGRTDALSKGMTEGNYLQLEISDSGAGMPPEIQARVFDPFFTTKSAGRGLGLAVVHGIVRNLCGGIHLSSEPGKGTTFQILLPCAETGVGAAAVPVQRSGQAALSQEATVLIVEDEDSLRQAVAKMLRMTGFEVLEAPTGSVAIDLLCANGIKIDAILLDMTIPGASSQEVVAAASEAHPNTKVVLTSAYSEKMVTAALTAPSIRGFIRKPFRLAHLVQTLQNVVSS